MNTLCQKIDYLPIELKRIIYEFLPRHFLIFTNCTNYGLYHHYLKPIIERKNQYDNYVRDMIRKDFELAMNFILNENKTQWLKGKGYTYKNNKYTNYLFFMYEYAIQNNSGKCKILIMKVLKDTGLMKNQHKKNIIRNIGWTN